jgi:hypothetical protein
VSEADLPSAGLAFARAASLGHVQLLAAAVYVPAVLTTIQRVLHVRRELVKAAA